jgi:hypothetical protein
MKTTLKRLLMLLMIAPGLVSAADPLPEGLEVCARLSRDNERLACYDRAVAALRAGQATPGVSPENMFGANSDNAAKTGVSAKPEREELKQITGVVSSLRRSDDGLMIIELENGQVWRQQDSEVRMMISPGDNVTIVRAVLGTFRITDRTGRFARFKRVR